MNRQTRWQPLCRTAVAVLLIGVSTVWVAADVDGLSENSAKRPCSDAAATKLTSPVRSPGKASIPVKFVNPGRFKANLGEQVVVSLTLLATEKIAQLQVQATTENARIVVGSVSDTSFYNIPAGEQVTLDYTVQPQTDGLSYVNVFLSTHSGQGKRMASYSIPVEVGDIRGAVATKSVPDLVVAEDGVVLEIMRARDTSPTPPRP
ncbi:MAG: hypothetical protein HKN70_09435 [Gammaproteobacteria bacterium]|nr:hypothetical protein [Gammaproteobacteria bacterium]